MLKRLAQILGIITAILVLGGLFMERGHFLGLMNVNIALDLFRIPIAAALLYAGYVTDNSSIIRNILGIVGVVYVLIAILGIINSKVWGLLPDGLTGFDEFFHLFTGLLAIWTAYFAREQVRKLM